MSAIVTSPEHVVNLALGRIGYKLRVNKLYEGTRAARIALAAYAETRDEVLRHEGKADWGFAERNVVATLLKFAPAGGYVPPVAWNPALHPPIPWLFEYAYPADCLKVRILKSAPLFMPNFDPQPSVLSIANDNALNPPQRVILSNVPNAIIVYTGQITDPTTWPQDFIDELTGRLARVLAPNLADIDAEKASAEKTATAGEQMAGAVAGAEER